MANLQNLLMGFSVVFTLQRLAVCVLGAILGLIVGAMPGIGSLAGCALLSGFHLLHLQMEEELRQREG